MEASAAPRPSPGAVTPRRTGHPARGAEEDTMGNDPSERAPILPPLGELEQTLIDEYVRARGYDPLKLAGLPDQVRRDLLKDASLYASTKLSEVESRSHFVHEIHEKP
jgi:hypothetical protein